MMFAIFLTAVFGFMMFYSMVFVSSNLVRYFFVICYASAVYFVWNPDSTTVIANYFGVGRGLDFIFLLLFLAVINGLIFSVTHLSQHHQSLTKLARHISIVEARIPPV